MMQSSKTHVSRTRLIILTLCLILLCLTFLGAEVQRMILRSRVVTQVQIEEGWERAGVEIVGHAIRQKENFWKVAKEYHVDIDTIVGANPNLERLSATRGQIIRVPNLKGVIHQTGEGETLEEISSLYNVPALSISTVNNLQPKHILTPGLELFVPGAKPVKLTEEMAANYGLRNIFGSPIPGRITSGMGPRTHPIGGFRGKHTGVDLAAREGTRITAAAAGRVTQTGEGEYIGKYIIISHQNSYTTLYGHCSEILTAEGTTVKKGQLIAKSGHTGRTTGPHLHFEIRKNGLPQDPLRYLW